MQFIWAAPFGVQQKRRNAGTETAKDPVTRKSLIALEIELSGEARTLLRDDLHVKVPWTRAINTRKDCPEAKSASFVRIGFPIELEVAVPIRCPRVIRMHVNAAMISLPNLDPGRRDRCIQFIHKPTRQGQFLPLRRFAIPYAGQVVVTIRKLLGGIIWPLHLSGCERNWC
jgi:hypothetical protein